MLIKDNVTGKIHEYGTNSHDSLVISNDGTSLHYYNLQCGEGSRFGAYSFVMRDGEIPMNSYTAEALHGDSYANIGGFYERPKEMRKV